MKFSEEYTPKGSRCSRKGTGTAPIEFSAAGCSSSVLEAMAAAAAVESASSRRRVVVEEEEEEGRNMIELERVANVCCGEQGSQVQLDRGRTQLLCEGKGQGWRGSVVL